MNEVEHFHLGWFITRRCNRSCHHCLRHGLDNALFELEPSVCRKVLRDFLDFVTLHKATAGIDFGGANPLLREDFPDLLQETFKAKQKGIITNISLLGNPETLDDAFVHFLAVHGVDRFWMSLDGEKATNDAMRGEGNYDAAVRGIGILVREKISTDIKFTLTRKNEKSLRHVVDLALSLGAGNVAVGQLMPVGGGFDCTGDALTAVEYRDWLKKTLEWTADPPYAVFRKGFLRANAPFLALLAEEEGQKKEWEKETAALRAEKEERQLHGNAAGLFVVLPDGEVRARRSFPRIGYTPRDSFEQMYTASPILRMLRDTDFLAREKLRAVLDIKSCDGCPAFKLCGPRLVGFCDNQPVYRMNDRLCWRRKR